MKPPTFGRDIGNVTRAIAVVSACGRKQGGHEGREERETWWAMKAFGRGAAFRVEEQKGNLRSREHVPYCPNYPRFLCPAAIASGPRDDASGRDMLSLLVLPLVPDPCQTKSKPETARRVHAFGCVLKCSALASWVRPLEPSNTAQIQVRCMYQTPGSFGTGVWSCAKAQLGPIGEKFSV